MIDHPRRQACEPVRPDSHEEDFWSKVIKTWILGYCDLQLVSGLALLTVALIRIRANQGQIRVYHFSIASDLAWFSSNTYLSSLVILREDYFKTSTVVRTIRAVGTVVMLALMILQTVYMGDKLWKDFFNCPTECLIEHLQLGGSNGTMSTDDIFWLVCGYGCLLGSMFEAPNRIYNQFLTMFDDFLESMTFQVSSPVSVHLLPQYVRYLALRCCRTVIHFVHSGVTSLFLRLVFDVAWYGASMYILVRDRRKGQALIGNGSENVWGFGQVLPCFLLLLPLLVSIEAFFGTIPSYQSGVYSSQ